MGNAASGDAQARVPHLPALLHPSTLCCQSDTACNWLSEGEDDARPHHLTRQPAVVVGHLASDAVTVLEIPQKFAPLRLFRRGCGSFCPSARSEASENCQPPAHTSPDWSTSRSAPAGSGRALRQPPHSPATSSSATTASTAPYRDAEPLCLPCAEVLSCYRPKLCLMRSHATLRRCMVSISPPRSGWARWTASR